MFKQRNGCFDCENCPKNNKPENGRFCVAWVEYPERNIQTDEVRWVRECWFPAMFKMMFDLVKSDHQNSEHQTKTTNAIVEGFQRLDETMRLQNQLTEQRLRGIENGAGPHKELPGKTPPDRST